MSGVPKLLKRDILIPVLFCCCCDTSLFIWSLHYFVIFYTECFCCCIWNKSSFESFSLFIFLLQCFKLAFHAPDSPNKCATWWLIYTQILSWSLELCPFCLPSHLSCPLLSSRGTGSYKCLVLFMSIVFYCRFFSSRHLTKVVGIRTPHLGRERALPRAAHKAEVRLMELQRTSGLCWMLSHRDSCSVTLSSASFQEPGSYVTVQFSDINFIWLAFFKDIQAEITAETMFCWTKIHDFYTRATFLWLLCVFVVFRNLDIGCSALDLQVCSFIP